MKAGVLRIWLLSASCLIVGSADAGTSVPAADPNIFVSLAKKVVPSVVNISTLSAIRSPHPGWGGGPEDEMFRRFFEDFFRQFEGPPGRGGPRGERDEKAPKAMSLGTGFIIDSSGLILTNNHVVAEADEIKITFTEEADEKPTSGEVVGRDPELDLALIKVKSERQMVPVTFGDSDALEVGEYVMAVGQPFGQGHSVTHGIISAKGRDAPDFSFGKYIQTDAPINPGNSGGPLVNLRGEVVGINNAILRNAQGIGFAIPANLAKNVLEQLKTKGTVSRGYIGVLVDELTPELAAKLGASAELRAPFVTHVYPGEPADKAGIKPYDVILQFNKKSVTNVRGLISAVTEVPVGQSAPIKVSRSGKELDLTLKVSQRPSAQKMAQKEERAPKKPKKAPAVDTGLGLQDLDPETARELGLPPEKATGVVVASVAFGSPADRAGLMRGDVILEVDRKPIRTVEDFENTVDAKKSYLVRVRRSDPQGGEGFTVIVLDLKEQKEQ